MVGKRYRILSVGIACIMLFTAACQEKVEECTVTVADFDQHLGLSSELPEVKIKKVLGKPSAGEYSADRSHFIYTYNELEALLTVHVHVAAKTGLIRKVASYMMVEKEAFIDGLNELSEQSIWSTCSMRLFGQTVSEVEKKLGKPSVSRPAHDAFGETTKELIYFTDDDKIMLVLHFNPDESQGLYGLTVNWF